MICRHCCKHRVNRPRGLCWSCYYTPGVTLLYPSTSKYAKRGVASDCNSQSDQPNHPTDALPGTEDKLAIMEERARRGYSVFHPDDAKKDPEQ